MVAQTKTKPRKRRRECSCCNCGVNIAIGPVHLVNENHWFYVDNRGLDVIGGRSIDNLVHIPWCKLDESIRKFQRKLKVTESKRRK